MTVYVVVDVNGYVVGVYEHEDDADAAMARQEEELAKSGAWDSRCFSYICEVQS